MAHQTFTAIRDEVVKRLGRTGVTAFNSRAEAWVDQAYREICQTWYHHELAVTPPDTAALAQGTDFVSVPATTFLVLGARLKSGSTLKGRLGWMRPIDLFGQQSTTQALPEHYTRFGNRIYFECPADAAYTVEMFCYRRPTDPAFSGSAAPEIDEMFDEVIIEYATAKGQGSLWRPDLSSQGRASLADLWQRLPYQPLGTGDQRDRDDGSKDEVPYGGPIG